MMQDQFGRLIPSSDQWVLGDSNPMVRIGNRMFVYDKKGYIRGTYPDLESLGFENKGTYFERPVNDTEIESAYNVDGRYAVYKGIWVYCMSFNEESVCIYSTDEKVGEASGITPYYDRGDRLMYCTPQYHGEVPAKDVTEIYEIRKAYKDFKFVGPEKVYHKINGMWIQRHFPGTPLRDDEWI